MSSQTFIQKSSEWIKKPKNTDANLKNYFKAYKTFRWKSVEKEFDWQDRAIDRHEFGSSTPPPAAVHQSVRCS